MPISELNLIPQNRPLRVLFVDDQQTLLNAIERVVRRQADNWSIKTAHSGPEAIKLMELQPFDVIVSDMRMPQMDGVELLEYVRSQHPNMIRMILSGYSKTERTIDAVRVAHQYFIKPYSTQNLIDALELTHTLYKKIRNPAVQGLIASIDRLPTPRPIFYEIQEAIADQNTSLDQIADIILKDSAITGKILQVVNSAFFGQSLRVDYVGDAIRVLGIEAIKSLVMIAGIASDHKEILSGIISIEVFSEHCFQVGMFCRWLAKNLNMTESDQNSLFTIGLLHDVGRLVLLKKYFELYTDKGWMEDPYTTKVHVSQIEKLAEEHACIGASLIALWGLPVKIVNAIAYYNSLEELQKESGPFAHILHLADAYSNFLHSPQQKRFLESDFANAQEIKAFFDEDTVEEMLDQMKIELGF